MFSRQAQNRTPRSHIPAVEPLEGRCVPSGFSTSNGSYWNNLVRHEYHVFVGDLRRLELNSRATPAEAQALRDDARAISQDASSAALSVQAVQTKALAVSLQLDRAPLDGSIGNVGWDVIATRLAGNVNGLNVPPSLIQRTVADMRAIADSAGVSAVETQHLDADMERLLDGEQRLGSHSYYRFPNPQLYYTQHLREFFRGSTGEKVAAQAQRDADLRRIQVEAGDNAADAAVLHRDARLLEVVDASLTSEAGAQLSSSYLALFAGGAPSAQALAQWSGASRAALGPGASAATLANVNQLGADAPTFFRAVGSSTQNASAVVRDVQALVAAGGGEPLDPFRVQLVRAGAGPANSTKG